MKKIMNKVFIAVIWLVHSSCTSSKHNLSACFTKNVDTAFVGDTIYFFNCTDWGNYPYPKNIRWVFGDGVEVDTVADTVTHVYQAKGEFVIKIRIGGPETKGGSFTDRILIQ